MMSSNLLVAQTASFYQVKSSSLSFFEILVDCPGIQGLYTYRCPEDLRVRVGDIVSVQFGVQQVGGIVIKELLSAPENLEVSRIKEIDDVIMSGFFTAQYWEIINQVASYYYTELMTVIRVALPPGLLRKETRRIKLNEAKLGEITPEFCSESGQQILTLLKMQKEGDYSEKYLRQKVRRFAQGIRELLKREWVISYLEPPKTIKPKLQKAIILINDIAMEELSNKQREALETLKGLGGEIWLRDFKEDYQFTDGVIRALVEKGCVIVENREKLRLAQETGISRDVKKQLTSFQELALSYIGQLVGYHEVLLHGITGSGKTEVYLQAIAPILAQGKSVLVLVPEIALTPQLTDRFTARFGDRVLVYHSALNDGERYDTWRNLLNTEQQILIGTRSAVFAPLKNIGLIILDEEHDSSYKQQQPAPNYHAKTVAQWRAKIENCTLILGSATPALETWLATKGNHDHASDNKHYLNLPERIGESKLPLIELVDLRTELQQGNRSIFSRKLQQALDAMHSKGEQGILFVPRRGHSTFVSCRSCGYVIECPHCDVSLSYHYTAEGAAQLLRCHYCNYATLQPKHCPECSSPYLKFFGSGTQKVVLELNKMFPEIRCLRFDSDTTRTKGAHRKLLDDFRGKKYDLLVGTQMLTKGIDVPGVTLVGVVAADGLLNLSDYRASERAFQTLTQVAGRAGRGDNPGKVIIQTYAPDNPVIKAVLRHNYEAFVTRELEERRELNYPPFGSLMAIKISGLEEVKVQETAVLIADKLMDFNLECEVLGPAPAQIMRIAQRYRWQILLKFSQQLPENLFKIEELREVCPPSISLSVDVDPLQLD